LSISNVRLIYFPRITKLVPSDLVMRRIDKTVTRSIPTKCDVASSVIPFVSLVVNYVGHIHDGDGGNRCPIRVQSVSVVIRANINVEQTVCFVEQLLYVRSVERILGNESVLISNVTSSNAIRSSVPVVIQTKPNSVTFWINVSVSWCIPISLHRTVVVVNG